MSESSLSLGYPDFQAEVGYYLGYTRSSANWNTDQTNDIDACIQGGLRLFYNPLDVGLPKHEWRFMRPTTRLSIFSAVAITSASWVGNVVTLGFTALAVAPPVGGSIVVSGMTPTGYNGTYIVVTSSTTQVTYALTTNPGASTVFGTMGLNDYAAPDDFGGIDGDFTYAAADTARETIVVVNEEVIRRYRQRFIVVTGRPRFAAIAWPKTDGSTGQRAIFSFWPDVDGSYTLTYKYRALLNKISASFPYPMGGMTHSETQKACMIAFAERHIDDVMNGPRWSYMVDRMRASINAECTGVVPEFYGYNGDRSDVRNREHFARTLDVTVKGVLYS